MLKRYPNEIARIPAGIKKLQERKDLYLYGNSIYALKMLDRMKKWHIDINGVLVSREYFSEDTFEGHPVYEAEKYVENCTEPISIVLGFWALKHPALTERLCKNKMIDHIFILNGLSYLFSKHFEFPTSKVILIDDYYEELIRRDLCKEYYEDNYELFYQTYEWLNDEKSKKTMEDYLSGHIELTEFPMMSGGGWKPQDIGSQYFPEDIIRLSEKEVFVDCGAYIGDTLENFLSRVKNYKKYYALEPDSRRFECLKDKMKSEKTVHIPVGAWNIKERLYFSTEKGCGEINDEAQEGNYIEVDAIDHIIPSDERITFIKMDIEGAELQALYGAEESIKRNRPKLSICVYHKREDLITIPQFIKGIVPEYKFYLRGHYPYAGELVLYGICD